MGFSYIAVAFGKSLLLVAATAQNSNKSKTSSCSCLFCSFLRSIGMFHAENTLLHLVCWINKNYTLKLENAKLTKKKRHKTGEKTRKKTEAMTWRDSMGKGLKCIEECEWKCW